MLSEKIRWVSSVTLEGDRLSAHAIVLRRSALIGARLDLPGWRFSFVAVCVGLMLAVGASVTAFAQTLQFFEPDYTMFAATLIPVIALAVAAWLVRPRRHLTLLIADGSALGLVSNDAGFLKLALEAVERLWADGARHNASLYLHAGHRSVDFGPGPKPVDTSLSNEDNLSIGLELPDFGDDEPVGDNVTDETLDAPEEAPSDDVIADIDVANDQARSEPDQDSSDARALSEDEDASEPDSESASTHLIPAQTFDDVRPKVATLSRLLRQRSASPALKDAIDILEERTANGCQNEREARALTRSVTILRGRMAVYPAAVQVLDALYEAADLNRFAQSDS